jgi:hypothetical protein
MRCTSSEDCIAGDCFDTGAGFSVCTLPGECSTDDDCLPLSSNPAFVCAEGVPGAASRCVATTPFQGANCDDSSDCAEELRCGVEACPPRECFHYSVVERNPQHGECRFQCDPEVGCEAFGGVPHVCLAEGGCYPGSFGIPCTRSSECLANLSCEAVPPDERSRTEEPKICTVSCTEPIDCTSSVNPWLGLGGYCVPAPDAAPGTVGFCRIGAQPGRPCDKPEQCLYRKCELDESGVRVCGDP